MVYNVHEVKLGKLLKLKMAIQELEKEQEKKKKLNKDLSTRIRGLGQEISKRTKELMNEIV